MEGSVPLAKKVLRLSLFKLLTGRKVMVNEMRLLFGGTWLGSECSNRKGIVHGAVNNSCRVLSVNEKRAHPSTFVKKIIVVAAKTS